MIFLAPAYVHDQYGVQASFRECLKRVALNELERWMSGFEVRLLFQRANRDPQCQKINADSWEE